MALPLRHRPLALLAVFCCVLGVGASSAGAQRPAPPGFIGLAPQTSLTTDDMELMVQAQVRSIRLPLPWFEIAESRPSAAPMDWSGLDHGVAVAAQQGMRVLPFAWGTPDWIAANPRREPVFSSPARRHWARFLRAAARRYGPGGRFWKSHPDLPLLPIRRWQIWNEPNIISFSLRPAPRRYARLVRISAQALHSVNPRAEILTAGLFGRTRKTPPNIRAADFLRRAFQGTGLRRIVDAVALHPYLPRARDIPSRIIAMRRVLRGVGRPRMPLWITEMGWGSDWRESEWEVGWTGQARELNRAMRLLTRSRRRWRIQRVYWYSWIDAPVCQFCDSAGLFTDDGRVKPAWYAFNSWTGGDPRIP